MPAASSCARDLSGMPSLKVITRSRAVTRRGMGEGTSPTTRARRRLSPTSSRLGLGLGLGVRVLTLTLTLTTSSRLEASMVKSSS